jgi:hypothetical protein
MNNILVKSNTINDGDHVYDQNTFCTTFPIMF